MAGDQTGRGGCQGGGGSNAAATARPASLRGPAVGVGSHPWAAGRSAGISKTRAAVAGCPVSSAAPPTSPHRSPGAGRCRWPWCARPWPWACTPGAAKITCEPWSCREVRPGTQTSGTTAPSQNATTAPTTRPADEHGKITCGSIDRAAGRGQHRPDPASPDRGSPPPPALLSPSRVPSPSVTWVTGSTLSNPVTCPISRRPTWLQDSRRTPC